jgi:nitrate reductase NapE component
MENESKDSPLERPRLSEEGGVRITWDRSTILQLVAYGLLTVGLVGAFVYGVVFL